MKLIAAIAIATLLPPSWAKKDADPPRKVLFQGSEFSLLRGSVLQRALLGHSLTEVPCGDSGQCIEAFYERGRYAQSEDRGVIRGRYVIRHDRYCAGWDDYQFCKAVYQSDDGRIATTNLKCGARCLKFVERGDAPRNGSDWVPID
jgi:hypothetical protein